MLRIIILTEEKGTANNAGKKKISPHVARQAERHQQNPAKSRSEVTQQRRAPLPRALTSRRCLRPNLFFFNCPLPFLTSYVYKKACVYLPSPFSSSSLSKPKDRKYNHQKKAKEKKLTSAEKERKRKNLRLPK
jgi:hypothetical protein